jgi:hypothetical protein
VSLYDLKEVGPGGGNKHDGNIWVLVVTSSYEVVPFVSWEKMVFFKCTQTGTIFAV